MTTIRVYHNQEHPYTVINRDGLRNKILSFKARGIWAYMLSFPNDWEFNLQHIINENPEGRTAITSGMKELQEHGLLLRLQSREYHKNGKYGFGSVSYIIFEFPISDREKKDIIEREEKANKSHAIQKKFAQSGNLNTGNLKSQNQPLRYSECNEVMKETTTPSIVDKSKLLPFSKGKEINYFHHSRKYLKGLSESDIRAFKKYFESQEEFIDNPLGWLTACAKGRWWEGKEKSEQDKILNHMFAERILDKMEKLKMNNGEAFYFGCDKDKLWVVVNGKDTTVPKFRIPHAKFKERLRKVLVERHNCDEMIFN